MKRMVYPLILLLILMSCETEDNDTNNENTEENTTELFDIVGYLELTDGPHDLAIKGSILYACRNDQVQIIDISDVTNPVLKTPYNDLENLNIFETMLISGNTLFLGCTQSSGIYALDITEPLDPSITGKFVDPIYGSTYFKPFKFFKANSILWATGSNGSNAMLVKFNIDNLNAITIDDYWTSNQTGNVGGGIWANSSNVFISTANGYIYSFNANDISSGPIDEYTFSNEAGHEHWGRKLEGAGNTLYWADWGAGFVTIDITDPGNLKATALITNSSFKSQYAETEGTDVYDFAFNLTKTSIFVANGWSGLFLVNTSNPSVVNDYVDYPENQYYCIEYYNNYVIVGDIVAGISDMKGIKIIKVE